MIRAFVFDLDGTLVETEELKALSYARAAAGLRPDLNEGEVIEAFKDLVGLSRQEVAVGLMRRFGLEDAARERIVGFGVDTPWQAYVQIRLRLYETLMADPNIVVAHRYPHNIALLCEVRREGYPTALATQSHREQARRVLDILGLADEFEVVVTRDDVEHGKPDPEMHLLAARELGVEPEECLAIEDSPAGVKAALAAGAEIVAVTTDLTRQKFRDTNLLDRSHIVDDPRTLPEVVRHLINIVSWPSGGVRTEGSWDCGWRRFRGLMMADGLSIAKLVGAVVACETAGGIGAFLSRQGLSEWYPTLRKPSFTPPGSYFGPTWTLLYALMGASLWLVEERGENGAAKRASRALFGAQLLLNVLWTYVFFGRRAPGWAFVEVVFLLVAIAATAVSFSKVSRTAALLLVPYLLWTGFASVLNFCVWRLNR